MGTNATDSHHLQFKQSESTYRIDNLCNLTSELLTDARLPQELIIEILLRLPVKSLLKFKCVSKSWLSLISSPQFVRSHFSKSSEADRYLNSQVLITTKPSTSLFTTLPPTSGIKQFSLYSALYEETSSYVSDVEYPSQKPFDDPSIAGIINGLVCLVIRGSFFLWNPVLRNYKHLPTSNVTRKDFAFFAYGFGYDDSNDDYKVVVLVSDNYLLGSDNVAVYSLLTDSWRRIEDFKSRLPFDFSGKYADGKIHWIVGSSARDCWKIVSLDMVSEKFGELQLPECEDGVSRTVFGVSGGQLSVLCNYHLKKVDLWVMDKYGVEESWSKVVSIPYDNLHPAKSNMYSYLPQVVCILRNGEIVLSDGSDLLVYNSKHKEFRNIELGGCGRCKFHVYVESLVSPNGLHSSDVISVV